jgi:hypothetical protein
MNTSRRRVSLFVTTCGVALLSALALAEQEPAASRLPASAAEADAAAQPAQDQAAAPEPATSASAVNQSAEAPSPVAPAAEPAESRKAAPGAYVIEQNKDSRVAKREVPGGYREVDVKGTVYWCRTANYFGTRVKKDTVCLTPQQYDVQMEESQDSIERTRRGVTIAGPDG